MATAPIGNCYNRSLLQQPAIGHFRPSRPVWPGEGGKDVDGYDLTEMVWLVTDVHNF